MFLTCLKVRLTPRFVMQMTAIQTNPENMPNTDMTIPDDATPESRKDQ